jgi:transcription antitermination factor NusG
VTRFGGALPVFDLQCDSDELLGRSPERAKSQSWFAINTRPRYEKKVTANLQEKGVDTFLPLSSATHQWSDRRRLVELPLFPGYVFVRISLSLNTRVSVLQTNGVISFVGDRNLGTPIPDCEIEAIQGVIEGGASIERIEPSPHWHAGQRVRICGGCFDGVTGVLVTVDGERSLVVSVNLIQRSIAMRIQGYKVEAI